MEFAKFRVVVYGTEEVAKYTERLRAVEAKDREQHGHLTHDYLSFSMEQRQPLKLQVSTNCGETWIDVATTTNSDGAAGLRFIQGKSITPCVEVRLPLISDLGHVAIAEIPDEVQIRP